MERKGWKNKIFLLCLSGFMYLWEDEISVALADILLAREKGQQSTSNPGHMGALS
jgi:hypothetical protein